MSVRWAIYEWLTRRGWEVRRWPHPSTGSGILKDLLARHGITTVLDVGANVGQYARALRRIGFQGRIVSYEPLPAAFEQLAREALTDPRWEGHQLALGATTGSVTLHQFSSSDLSSVHEPTPMLGARLGEGARVVNDIVVRVERLDEVFHPAAGERLLLKVDTQGHDLEVVRGATGLLDAVLVAQLELSFIPLYEDVPSALEVMEQMAAAGFGLAGLSPIVAMPDGRLVEADAWFVRAGPAADRPA